MQPDAASADIRSSLDWWASRLAETFREGKAVYAYFNNDPEGMAVVNAQELRSLATARIGIRAEGANER